MTSTIGTVFPTEHPSRLNLVFAQEPDKDLDFDEGFEDDESHRSKPPSRRPVLWIILVLLVIGVTYWTFKTSSTFPPSSEPIKTDESTLDTGRQQAPPGFVSPTFRENQTVSLANVTGDFMLMSDLANTKPGPIVNPGETLTILDGSFQPTGWVYQVRTQSGKTGWISSEKLKSQS